MSKLEIELRKDNHLYYNRYRTLFGIKISIEKGTYKSISEMKKNIENLFDAKVINWFIFKDYRNITSSSDSKTGVDMLEYLES